MAVLLARTKRLSLLLLAMCAGLLALPACQTALTFAPPSPEWQTYQGQMLHASAATGRTLVGDVVVRRSPDGREFQLQFSSGPGIPLLKLWESGDVARAEGVLARGSWQGRPTAAPAPLRNWVLLRDVFVQIAPGREDLRGPGWSATLRSAGGVPAECDITFTEGGERFAWHFTR